MIWPRRSRIELKTPAEIRLMRASGLVTAGALAAVRKALVPGVRAAKIDALAAQVIRSAGAEPNFLGYDGYPASICFSVNDVVVHGIPTDQVLRPGDVVSIDCGAVLDGWHSDAAITVGVGAASKATTGPADQAAGGIAREAAGSVAGGAAGSGAAGDTPRVADPAALGAAGLGAAGLDARSEALIEITHRALWDGIAAFATASHVGQIGAAIEASVKAAEPSFGVLREYVGHGIGSAMHMEPDVLNFASRERGPKIQPGMVLA
ncbi:MAG: M24 family metallopeptidase, partial [Bifidobacteriaceae bacterium]|nr:M24 family metallopeptidase [Bifidobacteriaceae bacterium]